MDFTVRDESMVVMTGNKVTGRFGVVSESFYPDPEAQGRETSNLEWCEFLKPHPN